MVKRCKFCQEDFDAVRGSNGKWRLERHNVYTEVYYSLIDQCLGSCEFYID